MATIRFDFGTGFNVTESPTGEFNISVDVSALAGTPALTFGTANAAGAASTFVRTDATLAAFDATVPTSSALGDAAAAGTAGVAARRDHLHGRESFATPALSFGTANAAGSATTPIRSDATLAIFDTTVPVTQASADAAATGSAAVAARRDHKHGMPVIGTSGLTWVGGDTTERTNGAVSQVDLVTISGLSIAQTSPILVTMSWRKTSGGAFVAQYGLKLNTTEVRSVVGVSVGTDTADNGIIWFWVNAAVASGQGTGVMFKTSAQGGGSSMTDISTARPAATVTSVIITALGFGGTTLVCADEVNVYTLAVA